MMQLARGREFCALAVALGACNDPPTAVDPPVMSVASVLPSEGVPGWQLADTPKVVLLDSDGRTGAGVAVTSTVREGAGTVARV